MKRGRTQGHAPVPAHRAAERARCSEIVADALERIDDERLELVTITSVEVEPDLRHAIVYFDTPSSEASDDEMLAAARREHRVRVAGARSAAKPRLKRTPSSTFRPDTSPHGRAHRRDPAR